MKDSNNTSLTIRAKVSSNLNSNSISSLTPLVRTTKFDSNNSTSQVATNPHLHNNNSDDEFELPLGNLIIDLDADIEKSNERLSIEHIESQPFTGSTTGNKTAANNSINKLSNNNLFEQTNSQIMSTNKTIRDVNNGTNSTQPINQLTNATQSTNLPNSSSSSSNCKSTTSSSTNLQSSTVDKSLKLKIKRKSIGGKSSESKLEVVQSDTNPRHNSNYKSTTNDKNGLNNLSNSTSTTNEMEKVKHSSSSKNKNSSHKERKEKKDKNSNNSISSKNHNDSFTNLTNNDSKETTQQRNPVVLNFDKKVLNQSFSNERPFNQINQLKKESTESPPCKKSKNEEIHVQNSSLNNNFSTNNSTKLKPEMRSVSTTTNASTMTEPECLGFCEPGSAICLEGITWIEAEGVLVVNVTWRGKSYVGTLLDCTRHDWGPPHPRLCDSPTSDLESKGLKSGRGKRARSSIISEQDSRLFQSKLRNGKGRRNFTVPASPLKVDQTNKRNNRNGKDSSSVDKSNNLQQSNLNRNTPTPTQLEINGSISSFTATKQPISPILIECPEPNCSKKYKHINGLKYHQTHSHSGTNLKSDDLDDSCKDTIVTTDTEDMDIESIANSPSQVKSKLSENNSCNETNDNIKSCDNVENLDKKTKANCDKNKNSENVQSPAYSDISDVNENGNELNDSSINKINNSSVTTDDHHKPEEKELKKNETNCEQIKENDLAKNETKPVKEEIDKSPINNDKEVQEQSSKSLSLTTNNNDLGLDKNNLNETTNHILNNNLDTNLSTSNLQQPQLSLPNPAGNPTMNPNFQFPFNMPPLTMPPFDPAIHAYFMQQDRLMMDEQKQQAYQATLNSYVSKTDPTMHLNELQNELQKQQRQHQQFKTPPLSTSSSQTSSIFSQSTSNQQSQNKPSSPYDFIHHEKQQREEMLKLSSNRAEERFSLSKNQSLGNLSSPKQQAHQLFNQQQNNNLSMNKDEQRSTPKHLKQDEGIKPTGTTTGPPPAPPTNSFFHPMSQFFPPTQGPPQVFPSLSFDPNSQLFRAQQAAASNPFNQSFMNNFPFSISGHQLSTGRGPPNLPNLTGQDMNSGNKLMNNALNANGNKKAFDMFQQVPQQYNLKEMQDKMLISPTNKNGLPTPVNLNNSRQSSNQLGSLTNTMRKQDNLSPQRLHHPGIQQHQLQPQGEDLYGALINSVSSGFPK